MPNNDESSSLYNLTVLKIDLLLDI